VGEHQIRSKSEEKFARTAYKRQILALLSIW